ncbi:MAG: hypothetical protein K2L78_04325, partial [Muribaculaceae bacterium]|nr:hypothetical protein [Muribaculaceae bacterium]
YLSATESDVVDIATDATSVSINLYRVNADEALTVELSGEVLGADGNPATQIFSVPSQVSFPAGATVVPIEIGVVFGDVTPEEQYTLDLKVLSDEANPYGLTERKYIITYAPWSEWELYAKGKDGDATVTLAVFLKGTAELPLYERKSLVNENKLQYMFPDPLTLDLDDPDFDVLTDCDWYYIFSIDKTQTIEIDGKTYNRVTTNIVDTQKPYAGGEKRLFGCSWSIFEELLGRPASMIDALIEANNWQQSYFDPEAGLISVYTVMVAQASDGLYPQGAAYEYVLLPGFHDYWIEFAYLGNFVDGSGLEKAVVEATRCPDLASFVYECYPGQLSESEIKTAVDKIKDTPDYEPNYDATSNLSFVFSENGWYTIVAVGYDEGGNAVYDTSYSFEYQTVMKESEWESVGWCQYTDGFFLNIWYNPQLGGQTWDVEVEENKKQPGYYRLVNPYAEWPMNLELGGALSASGMYYLYINATDPDGVYVEQSNSGLDLSVAVGQSVGMSIFSSFAFYNLEQGVSLDVLKANGYC